MSEDDCDNRKLQLIDDDVNTTKRIYILIFVVCAVISINVYLTFYSYNVALMNNSISAKEDIQKHIDKIDDIQHTKETADKDKKIKALQVDLGRDLKNVNLDELKRREELSKKYIENMQGDLKPEQVDIPYLFMKVPDDDVPVVLGATLFMLTLWLCVTAQKFKFIVNDHRFRTVLSRHALSLIHSLWILKEHNTSPIRITGKAIIALPALMMFLSFAVDLYLYKTFQNPKMLSPLEPAIYARLTTLGTLLGFVVLFCYCIYRNWKVIGLELSILVASTQKEYVEVEALKTQIDAAALDVNCLSVKSSIVSIIDAAEKRLMT